MLYWWGFLKWSISLLETDEATKPSTLPKIRHEKVGNEKFENLEMRAWWEFGQIGEMRAKRENERKEKREIKWEFAQIRVPW